MATSRQNLDARGPIAAWCRLLLWLWLPALLATTGCNKDTDGDGVPDHLDCAPRDPTIYPGAPEICNGKDDDCDGRIDEGVAFVAYWDGDGDGYGDPDMARRVCELPDDGALVAGDCDDTDPLTYPGAPEVCDGKDNDCDGIIDEDAPLFTFWPDADGDGYGAGTATIEACFAPEGYAPTDDDCDDADPLVHPGAPEQCNGKDDDCNGLIDDGLELTRHWVDADGDGAGDPDLPIVACGPGPGISDNDLDCDDADPAIGPHAVEIQGSGVDEDCDGYQDEYEVPVSWPTVQDALAVAPDGAVIQLGAGLHVGTIDLGRRDVTLAGEGCERTTLYGDQQGTVVTISAGRIEHLAIEGGSGTLDGVLTEGGGVLVGGDVTASRICVRDNSVTRYGGGVLVADGTFTLLDSEVTDNLASRQGGGIYVKPAGRLVAERSVVSGNTATDQHGGGVAVAGGEALLRSTVIAGNSADERGGGLYVTGDYTLSGANPAVLHGTGRALLENTTFHANHARVRGPAIHAQAADLLVHNSLFTGHDAPVIDTLLIVIDGVEHEAHLDVRHSAFSGNRGPDLADLEGERWLLDALRLTPDYVQADPAVSPRDWNLRLLPGSAAIDAGDPDVADPDGSRSDLGAWGGPRAGDDFDWSYALDSDGDGMSDGWEIAHGLNRWVDDAALDPDGDGLTNLQEAWHRTSPLLDDTDGDGVSDGAEVAAGTDPLDPRDQAPTADAGRDRWVRAGEPLTLTGTASWDPNLDPLTFAWTVDATPPGSVASAVSAPGSAVTTFTPDIPGTYAVRLTVSDGGAERDHTVRVHAFDGLVVPDDATTVQAAVDFFAGNGTILVRPGTWVGPVVLGSHDIHIVGLGEPHEVVLDAGGAGSVVTTTGGVVTLARLTLANGRASNGAGIHATNTDLTLGEVVLRDNVATGGGGGVWAVGSTLRVADSWLVRNQALEGAGVRLENTASALTRTTFADNVATGWGGAIHINGSGSTRIHDIDNCVFQGNAAFNGAVLSLWHNYEVVNLRYGAIVGNRGRTLLHTTSSRSALFVMNTAVAHNTVEATALGNFALSPRLWPLANLAHDTGVVWFEGVGAYPELPLFLDGAPHFGAWIDDGDPTNDRFAPRPGSPMIDAGFFDWRDIDSSRSDIGPGGGPLAARDLPRFARDDDGDGMSDGWEVLHGLDPTVDDGHLDADGDGLTNLQEYEIGTSPQDPDTDGDGVSDADEVAAGTDPLSASDNRPVAVAGGPYIGLAGETITLDGTASSDPNDDPLTFEWKLLVVPAASALTDADLEGADTPTPTLLPDVRGTYLLELVVHDGKVASPSSQATVHAGAQLLVPEDYPTVADALAAAIPGDALVLGPGGYDLALHTLPSPLTLRGAGVDETYLQGTGLAPILTVRADEAVTLEDLTLTASVGDLGGAISCSNGRVDLTRVRAEFNAAHRGGAIHLSSCTAHLTDVDLADNDSMSEGGGLYAIDSSLTWIRGHVGRNRANGNGGGAWISTGEVTLRNLVIHHNIATTQGGGIFGANTPGGTFSARHLTVVSNLTSGVRLHYGQISQSIFQGNTGHGLHVNVPDVQAWNNGYAFNGLNGSQPLSVMAGSDNETRPALFVRQDPAGHVVDYRLRDRSRMIDRSDDTLDPDGTPGDLGGFGGPFAPDDFDAYYRDTDGDGMPDVWELAYGLDPLVDDARLDPDGDGLSNLDEYLWGTDPHNPDTDGDGISDGDEVANGTHPLDPSDGRPTALAGADQVASVGVLVSVDGSGSYHPLGRPLTYRWSIVAKPGRSALEDADLLGATGPTAGFTPDTPGAYDLELVVSDDPLVSLPDVVRVTVVGDVYVPEDYDDLRTAFDLVADGSAIHVGPGVWPLRLNLADRDLTLYGAGRDLTILDAEEKGQVLRARRGETIVLADLTLTGGIGAQGGAIHVVDGALDLSHVTLQGNKAATGGALYAEDAVVTGAGVRIVDNVSARGGGGVHTLRGESSFTRTLFAGNTAVLNNGGAFLLIEGATELTNVIISDNVAGGFGGGLHLSGNAAVADLAHVTATYNRAAPWSGAFLSVSGGVATVRNSLFAHNGQGYAVRIGLPLLYDQTYTLVYHDYAAETAYFGFLPGSEPSPTHGNLDDFPSLFGITEDGDWTNDLWQVLPGSPARAAGDPTSPANWTGTTPPDLGAFGGPLGDWTP